MAQKPGKKKPKAGKKKAAPKFRPLPPQVQDKTAMRADALAAC